MKRTDLDELRAAFSRVNLDNVDSLKCWFSSHPHLTTNEHAQIARKSAHYIRRLKKKAGIHGKQAKHRPRPFILPKTINIDVPENWNSKEWLSKAVQIYSINQIAKAVHRTRRIIKKHLRRHSIKWEDNLQDACRSDNPCCTHAWCYQHYIELNLSQEKCAELAGIAQQTFAGWLNRFEIPVRDGAHARNGKKVVQSWERELVYKLKQQPVVKRVYVREGYIHVRFRNFFWENYYQRLPKKPRRPYTYFSVTKDNYQLNKVPLVYPEYGVDIEGKPCFPAHIAISRTDLKAASLVERRLALHEYTRQIISRGWIWPSFPYDVLEADFERVKSFNMAKYLENGGFTAFPRSVRVPPGRKVMMHFFDLSAYWKILRSPMKVVKFLNILIDSQVQFNLFNLLLTVAANDKVLPSTQSIILPDPVVYHAIFKRLGLKGTLLDVNVGFGNRAIACAAAGLTYTTPDPAFEGVIERGFLEFSGLDYIPYSGQKVDIVLYDEGFRPPIMDKVIPYLNKTTKLLVFAPPSHKEEVLKYKPTTAIRVRTRFFNKTPGYLFVW